MKFKMKVKEKLKKMKCMEGLIFLYKYRKDSSLRKVIKSYTNQDIVIIENSYGNMNFQKKYHYIKINHPNCGFFACWWWTLYELVYSDEYGLIPVVDWTKDNAYYEEKGINGVFNPFEYYFERVSECSVDEVKKSNNVYEMFNIHTEKRSSYTSNVEISKLIKAKNKYIKLKPEVQDKINSDINGIIGNKKTLAVHIRGVEWGNIEGNPIPLNIDKYIEKIDEALASNQFEQIFLATDSDDNIMYLKKKYGDKVIFYNDVARAKIGSKTLALFDDSIKRENNHYLLGLEVLRDMLTMAYCDGFIAGVSNVSKAVEITKLSNNEQFYYIYIFEQKIKDGGVSVSKAVKKMKKATKEEKK